MPRKSSRDTLKLFNGIFLKGIIPPACSRLYGPDPIGVGTPFVESLTSYIVRLASAHCVTVGALIGMEIAQLIGKDYLTDQSSRTMSTQFTSSARAVNGVGVTAEDWVDALQHLTLQQELRSLTMLPWKGLISNGKLLRKNRAWCPNCYEEWRLKEKPIYDPLLWSLETVIACPVHKGFLREKCVQCKKSLPTLPRCSLPGFCPHCNSWLGGSSLGDFAEDEILPNEQLDWQRYVVCQLGEVFTVLYHGAPIYKKSASHVISTCIQRTTRGDLKSFVRRFNSFSYSTMQGWLKEGKSLELGRLVEICYRTGVVLKDILSQGNDCTNNCSQESAPIRSKDSYYVTADDMVRIKAALNLMIKEDPPPSQNEVSRRIGCHVFTLSKHFPEQFNFIAERFSNFRDELYDKEKIKASLIAAKEENPPPSLSSVAKGLGCSRGLLRLCFSEDCKIISKRYAERRKVFVDIEDTRAKLLELQAETPPLSIIQCAERLGYSRHQLSKRFKDITHAIGIRYYKHCQTQTKRRRNRRKKIILETVAALEAEQVTPSGYQVKKRLRDQKQKKLTNREIEAVLRETRATTKAA